jgi:Na+/phosphate symporter
MIADFSVLELHLDTWGHVFGALAVLLLGMNRIRSSMRRLKVLLQRSMVILSSGHVSQ